MLTEIDDRIRVKVECLNPACDIGYVQKLSYDKTDDVKHNRTTIEIVIPCCGLCGGNVQLTRLN